MEVLQTKENSNKLQIFSNSQLGNIRTTIINNQPYLCLADVCKILDLNQASRVKTRLNQDGVTTSKVIDNLGRTQQAIFINESNLYKVIFQSKKKEAEQFTEWVTSEVLPQIRNHGMYATNELLDNPDLAIKVFTEIKQKRDKIKELEEANEKQKPLLLFAKTIANSNDCINISMLAKLISNNGYCIGQNQLFEYLRLHGYLISQKGNTYNVPYQKYINQRTF